MNTDKKETKCSCGKELDTAKKFCTSCGLPNPLFTAKPEVKTKPKPVIPSVSSTHCDCGAEYPATGKFCVKCGKPLSVVATPQTVAIPPVVKSEQEVQQVKLNPEKKKSGKKFLKYAAVFIVICVILTGGYFAYDMFFGGIRKKLLIEQKIVPSEEDQTVKYENDISVTVPFGLIDTEETLSISSVKGLPDTEGLSMLDAYEVKITNVTEIDGFIEITIKYDASKIPSGMSASRALTCMYYNESTSEWEAVPFMIDEASQQMTVYTPHLSIFAYGAAKEKVKPAPMMKVATVPFPAGDMLEEGKVIKMLQMYGGGSEVSATGQGMLEGWAFVNEWFGITAQVSTFAENALEVGALQGCNQIATEIGLGFALIQAAIDFSSGKKDKAVLELTKNLGNYTVLKIFNTAALNVAFGVFLQLIIH